MRLALFGFVIILGLIFNYFYRKELRQKQVEFNVQQERQKQEAVLIELSKLTELLNNRSISEEEYIEKTNKAIAELDLIEKNRESDETDMQSDLDKFNSMALLKNSHVDELAEAEIYLAYGRRNQAIDILEKALREHPDRKDIQAKLDELRVFKR